MHGALAIQDLTDLAVALPKLEASLGRASVAQARLDHPLLPKELLGNPIQGSPIRDLLLVVVRGDLGSFRLFGRVENGLDGSSSAGCQEEGGNEEGFHGTFCCFGFAPLGDGSDEV